MANKQGSLTINSENIFPIIKKWLYSDHDIFIRELISNGVDAITKLKRLSSMGEADVDTSDGYKVIVYASAADKTLTFIDNGIGMTEEEVDKYINQIAFSGATDFLEKYKDKDQNDQIIGHFGLGFYSAFMVSDKVTIETLSYKEGAKPVYWECDGGTTFSMKEGDKSSRGTKITLYLSEDSLEFANEYRVREIINKYCSFMPVEIYFVNVDEEKKKAAEKAKKEAEKAAKKAEKEASKKAARKKEEDDFLGGSSKDDKKDEVEDAEFEEIEDEKEEEEKPPVPLNDTNPLWVRMPSDCKDEDYKDFYQKVFLDFKEPLFWIHLNMDYPFNLKGILYFPRINPTVDQLDGKVKLYNNQVFVADNIKEVIPEFLLTLKGIIDCPDLPLNVSRSALQNDGFVKKISDYITKKVADKLIEMYKKDKEKYESLWEDISPFIKFGALKDDKFQEKMKNYMIFKNIEGKYITLPEYLEAAKEKHENKVFYITDEREQAQYIEMFKSAGTDAIYLTHNIDNPYITNMEVKNEGVKFMRIDADVNAGIVGESLDEETVKGYTEKLTESFKKALNVEKITIKVENLKDENISSMLTQSEEQRRMAEMMKAYSFGNGNNPFGDTKSGETLVLNANNKLVKYVLDNPEGENTETVCCQLYDLAVLANRPLDAKELTEFVARSNKILGMIVE
ncbi:molecular chaperone HtpG [Eubacterium ruminantium]|uniref:Molecular chaperone HtpG n=1 Tax=Eubacterium ruminantium TaxID=42322 RepID=A0A1T4PDI4_9FIRM|nr:molecular chaperone HtpG [Eubacterium ruminantium]SCW58315.1 molecular chaperone HtpG [Eubacterium ruminantium]SDM99355.1 molecular chaperone HtpG [Eubacterium ruminantium]SJZ88888.1 molecular chaperone HtpG [Eubacterium ruminantium]